MKLLAACARVVPVLALVLAACVPGPPERLRTPTPRDRPADDAPVRRLRERPEIDLLPPVLSIDVTLVDPDPMHELRWPLGLSEHPELSPQFEIAKVLAEPGVDWIELCKMGAHRRTIPRLRDQLLYLRAWCAAGAEDLASAIETLTRLRTSVVPGLAAAVRADLGNLLVSHQPDNVRELATKYGIVSDGDVLDRVAATYADFGNRFGANEINELVLANDSGLSPAKTCHRLARRVLLDPEAYRTSKSAFTTKAPVPGFTDDPSELLFGAKLGQDPRCAELDAQLSCWLVKSNCAAWYQLHGITHEDASLLDANTAWPREKFRASEDAWWRVVKPALDARPKAEAYLYAVMAIEASLKLTDCTNAYLMNRLEGVLTDLVHDQLAPAAFTERVRLLRDNRTKLCFVE